MKALVLLIFFSSFAFNSFAKEKGKTLSQEEKRWNKINRLIEEEITTIHRAKKMSDKIMYRLFELKSEKLKLIKEKENKSFMADKMKHGSKVKRQDSFRKTLSLYKMTNDYGQSILKKYPNTKFKAAIFYTLALNSRDFSYDNKELGFLRKAIEHSGGQEQVNYLARTSLAEYYYNNKNWKSAIAQYNTVIKNKDDEWYTKNLLNYGWCLLKDHHFDQAINSLEKSYKLSSDEFYVDVRDQAMTGLISFYVLGKQITRGIQFIDKFSNNKNESHLKLAQKAAGKGYYEESQKIIDLLENRIDSQKETELYADFRLFQFDFYKQFHKSEKLLTIAKLFQKTKFNDYQREDAIRKVSDVVGTKQVILKKDFSKHNQEYDKNVLDEIVSYFKILSNIDSKEQAQYEYFTAETYFSIQLYKEALQEYKNSLISYDKTNSKEDLRAKNMDAIFACIDNIQFNKKDKQQELVFAFNKYLNYWPKDEKAQKIYPRLFGIYQERKDFVNMQASLDRYVENFKSDLKNHQDLYRVQLDLLIKDKDTQLLALKINQMQKGYLNFTKVEVKKSETILANILFEQYKQMNENGEPKKALAGYQKVHFTDYYPKSIKGEAAFNMGMIYTDLEDNNNAFKWYKKSFQFMTRKEIAKKRLFLEKMALRTALLHNFLNAAKLEKFIVGIFCSEKDQNQKNFINAIHYDLANDYVSKVNYTFKKYSKCVNEIPNSLKKEVMTHLFENKHFSSFESFVEEHKLAAIYKEEIAFYLERIYWNNYKKSKFKEVQYLGKLRSLNTKSTTMLLQSLNLYDKLKEDMAKFNKEIILINKKNPDPNKFINDLTARMNHLKKFNEKANHIFELGHGQVSVLVYDLLVKLGENFSNEVLAYKIPIPDNNFQKQFKNEMNKIASTIQQETKNLKTKSQNLIEKYELLLGQREDSHSGYSILEVSDIRPKTSEMAITFGLGK